MPWTIESYEASFTVPSDVRFVADEDGAIAGYVVFSVSIDEGELLTIAVGKSYRRAGVGRLLMTRLFEIARERGVRTIFLEVRPSNLAAKSLYQKFGFETIGVRTDYYTSPVEDAEVMRKEL